MEKGLNILNKTKLGTVTFVTGLAIGAATVLLNKNNRIVLKEKATVLKVNSTNFGEKVKDTVVNIQSIVTKDTQKVQEENPIPEQLELQHVSKQGKVEEELEKDLFTGNGEVLVK